jgi:hypothetical protein
MYMLAPVWVDAIQYQPEQNKTKKEKKRKKSEFVTLLEVRHPSLFSRGQCCCLGFHI